MSPDVETPEVLPLTFKAWQNGNPYEQIKFGTYARYRHMLKGFSESQLATFDTLNEEVNGKDTRSLSERKLANRAKKSGEAAKKTKKVVATKGADEAKAKKSVTPVEKKEDPK